MPPAAVRRAPLAAALLLLLLHARICCSWGQPTRRRPAAIRLSTTTTALPPAPDIQADSAQIGADASLKCDVSWNSSQTISWYKIESPTDAGIILTINDSTINIDQRYYVTWEENRKEINVTSWYLNIRYVQPSDGGLYKCVAGDTETIVNLVLINATAEILNGDQRVRKDEPLRLSCILRNHIVDPSYILWYRNDTVMNYARFNGSIRQGSRGSELIIPKAQGGDQGNYTCVPSNALQASVYVTIIQTVT